MRQHSKLLLATVAALLLGVGAVSIAIAATDSSDPVPVAEQSDPQDGFYTHDRPAPSTTAGLSPALKAAYGIFRQRGTAADVVTDSVGADSGSNGSLARLAFMREDETTVHLVPAQGAICIKSGDYLEAGCIPEADALSGDNAQSIICAPGLPNDVVEIYGILPDEARAAKVLHADGTTRPLDVRNNAYIYRAPRADPLPQTLQFELGGKTQSVAARIPADAVKERCA